MKKKLLLILSIICMITIVSTVAVMAEDSEYAGVKYFSKISKYLNNEKDYIDYRYDGWHILNGIDVSEYQTSVDWAAVKADGIDCAIIRAGWRGYGSEGSLHEDTHFAQHIKNAKANDVMVGIYFFSQACSTSEAVAEADRAIAILESHGYGPNDLDLPIVMDYEFAGINDGGRMYEHGLDKKGNQSTMTPIAKAFCDRVKSKGYKAGFYGNYDMYCNHINYNGLGSDVFAWYAQYAYYPERASNFVYDMWQYDSGARVAGVSGKVDIDYLFLDPNKRATTNKSIANCSVDVGTNGYFQYSGSAKAHKPEVVVSDGNKVLTPGTDYGVGYFNNISTGTAYAYVYGIGDYSDYKIKSFEIVSLMPAFDEELTPPEEGDITSEEYKVDVQKYITGVDWNTKYQDFKTKIAVKYGYTFKAVDKNGNELADDAVVGTGTKINIYEDGELKSSILVCIRGDFNGDGLVKATDVTYGIRVIMGTFAANTVQRTAVDVNGKGGLTASDITIMKRHIMGTLTMEK